MMSGSSVLAFVGRCLLSFIFLASAFGKINNFDGTSQYMAAHGVPLAQALCVAAILCEVLGGLSVLLGFYARSGAAILIVFLVPTTLIFHLAADQRVHLLKNLAIIGGLMQVASFGPGEWSLDHKAQA